MKIDDIDITATLEQAKLQLEQERNISPSLKTLLNVLFVVIAVLTKRLGLNSKNSSKPPSSDPNRKKEPTEKSTRKAGGQMGHVGTQLQPVKNPDEIIELPLDKTLLPKGKYHSAGYDARQVIRFKISKHVIEYRAQILENAQGEQWMAAFPEFVTRPAQYGNDFKSHAVYLSQFQLLPYNRVEDYFRHECQIPISQGSLCRFNQQAYDLLVDFDAWVKEKLINARLLHVDETGINVNAKQVWLHVAANEQWTYFYPHIKRGNEATNDIGILPKFKGTLCHDHWKPYFIYQCLHALCNAHHLRELERAFEQDHQAWAKRLQALLLEINQVTKKAGCQLSEVSASQYCQHYRTILEEGKKECPLPEPEANEKKRRGRVKKSKSRNLLERLINFEDETLRFMKEVDVPFSNNLAENNLRMTKVQRKISGCFRSMEGAYIFCRIRSYISTCRKHQMSVTEALNLLFDGKKPVFMQNVG